LSLIFLLGILFQTQAQTKVDPAPPTTSVKHRDSSGTSIKQDTVINTYTMPTFQGGNDQIFLKYISENIIVPAETKSKKIYGTLYVEYIIQTDGSVSDVRIVPGRGLSPTLNKASVDVISKSPKWVPGTNNGIPVPVRKITRINFNPPK